MDVILLERIENLGQMGDVVNVRPGYARNFLLPQKKALRASKSNMEVFENQRAQLEALNLKRRDEAQAVAGKMEGLTVLMVRQAGEAGHLYGSVSARDIMDAIKESGFTVSRSQINLDQPIKTLGRSPVKVSLHPEVAVTVTVVVARSQEEAERAANAQQEAEAAEAAAAAAEADEAVAAPEETEAQPE